MTVLCVFLIFSFYFFARQKGLVTKLSLEKINKTNDKTAIISIAIFFHLVLCITADKSIVPAKHTIYIHLTGITWMSLLVFSQTNKLAKKKSYRK